MNEIIKKIMNNEQLNHIEIGKIRVFLKDLKLIKRQTYPNIKEVKKILITQDLYFTATAKNYNLINN